MLGYSILWAAPLKIPTSRATIAELHVCFINNENGKAMGAFLNIRRGQSYAFNIPHWLRMMEISSDPNNAEPNVNVRSVFSKSPYYSLQMMTDMICESVSQAAVHTSPWQEPLGFSQQLTALWLFHYERVTFTDRTGGHTI